MIIKLIEISAVNQQLIFVFNVTDSRTDSPLTLLTDPFSLFTWASLSGNIIAFNHFVKILHQTCSNLAKLNQFAH